MFKVFVHNFCVEDPYSLIEEFVSRALKFRVYEEKLTWAQVLFKICIINFVDDIVRINICCLDKKAIWDVFVLT